MEASVLTAISVPALTSDERIRIPAIVLRITPVIPCELIKIAFSFFSRTSMREKGRESSKKEQEKRGY